MAGVGEDVEAEVVAAGVTFSEKVQVAVVTQEW